MNYVLNFEFFFLLILLTVMVETKFYQESLLACLIVLGVLVLVNL